MRTAAAFLRVIREAVALIEGGESEQARELLQAVVETVEAREAALGPETEDTRPSALP